MTRQHKNKNPARLLRSLYMWHRWIGLVSALFVLLLASTGLLLNHTDELALDKRYVTVPALLEWYGIRSPGHYRVYRAGTQLVAELDGHLFFDRAELNGHSGRLLGALRYHDMVVAALPHQLLLLTTRGELIESLDNLPGTANEAIGLDGQQQLVLRTAQGDYLADDELLGWNRAEAVHAGWSAPAELSDGERAALAATWRGKGLPLERVLLDLHSGRILGAAGVYLMDGAALVLMLLAASGVWLWNRRRTSARAHRRKLRHRPGDAG